MTGLLFSFPWGTSLAALRLRGLYICSSQNNHLTSTLQQYMCLDTSFWHGSKWICNIKIRSFFQVYLDFSYCSGTWIMYISSQMITFEDEHELFIVYLLCKSGHFELWMQVIVLMPCISGYFVNTLDKHSMLNEMK